MNKITFVANLSVKNANPNGDPDAGGGPRKNSQEKGIITDVCIKHKIRMAAECLGYNVLISPKQEYVTTPIDEVMTSVNKATESLKGQEKKLKQSRQLIAALSEKFWDVRVFGAVLTVGKAKNTGARVTGPISIAISESYHPIDIEEVAITKCVPTKVSNAGADTGLIGSKSFVNYGLYKITGAIFPTHGKKSNLTDNDVEVFFNALKYAFSVDVSAARPAGSINLVDLHIFTHDNKLGNVHDAALHNLVNYKLKDEEQVPNSFDDYELESVTVPEGVKYCSEMFM